MILIPIDLAIRFSMRPRYGICILKWILETQLYMILRWEAAARDPNEIDVSRRPVRGL